MGIKSDVEDLVAEFGVAGLMAYNVDAISAHLGPHPHPMSFRIHHLYLLVGYVENLERESNQRRTTMDVHGTNFDFGVALAHMREGRKVARAGWNGKGMFCFLVRGSKFTVSRAPLNQFYPEGTDVEYRPHIDMKYVDGTIGVWVASHSDMLSDDWMVVS